MVMAMIMNYVGILIIATYDFDSLDSESKSLIWRELRRTIQTCLCVVHIFDSEVLTSFNNFANLSPLV